MTDFERYRPAMVLFFGGCCMVPLLFGAITLRGGSPITPSQYGEIVWSVPALVWVAVQLAGAALAALGAAFRWPRVAAFGAAVIAAMMIFLAAGAVMAGATGTLVVAGAGLWLGPLSAIAAAVAWRDRNAGR